MKTRSIILYSLLWGAALFAACDNHEDANEEENALPPGREYVKEGNYCLNVVYYIPKGADTLADWHTIYSSYVKTLQAEFREQMAICGYPDKTFNLEVNRQNPAYVNIIRLEGQIDTVGSQRIVTEVADYLNRHPEQNKSFFTAIFVPYVGLSTSVWSLESEMNIVSRGIISSYSGYPLGDDGVGNLMMMFGGMFFLEYNTEPITEIYYSMMNFDNGPSNWGKASRLLKADAMWLNQNQIFNHKEKAYYADRPEVQVVHADFKYENDRIEVACEFTSSRQIVGVIVYNDPWSYPDREDEIGDNNYTTMDAIPYATDQLNQNGTSYRFTLHIPWKDLPVTYKVPEAGEDYCEAEIRFRFLVEDGLAVPLVNKGDIESGFRYPYKIKNYIPDFQDKVDTAISAGK